MEKSQINTVIRKKEIPVGLDEMLSQLESDTELPTEVATTPLDISDQVKNKMITLMDKHLLYRGKLEKINQLRKELITLSNNNLNELETIMKFYGLNELIKGQNKFILDRSIHKKPLQKKQFKQVITSIVEDVDKITKIYETADQMAENVVVEKIKCLKYNEKDTSKETVKDAGKVTVK